jgi:hypothetical protein
MSFRQICNIKDYKKDINSGYIDKYVLTTNQLSIKGSKIVVCVMLLPCVQYYLFHYLFHILKN